MKGENDVKQVEALYNTYFHDVYLYVKSLSKNDDIAEEITQETFFKAMKSLQKFKGDCDLFMLQIESNASLAQERTLVIPSDSELTELYYYDDRTDTEYLLWKRGE